MNWINSFILSLNRRINSIYYRTSLLAYGILLSLVYPTLPSIYYVFIFLLYMLYVFFYTYKIIAHASNIASYIRTFFDFIFIFLCLYGKSMDNIACITMLYIPIVNAINHTGKRKGHIVYILGLIILYLLLSYIESPKFEIQRVKFSLLAIVPLLFIHKVTSKKWLNNNNTAILQDTINNIIAGNVKKENLYSSIKNIINKRETICKTIVCFITHDDFQTLHVVNASQFVYNYSILLDEKQIKLLKEKKEINNLSFKIEDIQYNYSYCLPIFQDKFLKNDSETAYLFTIGYSRNYNIDIILRYSLNDIFTSFAQYLYNEREIKQSRIKNFEEIKKKGKFVEKAINTMHFIKNRLSSIQTLTDLINDIEYTSIDENKYNLLRNTAKRANVDIQSIIHNAKYLLDQDINPFHYINICPQSPRSVLTVLRQVWGNSFPTIPLSIIGTNFLDQKDLTIDIDIEGVEILFSDIIGNMLKYRRDLSLCTLSCSDQQLSIKFKNDYDDDNKIKELIKSYNSNDKKEIIRRKTYGVTNIKSFVADTKIDLEAVMENQLFILNLKMKINENTNY